jgi:hypothetical protein
MMSNTIDLDRYRDKTYLELVLTLVEEARKDMIKGDYDLVHSQLSDILEIFDKTPASIDKKVDAAEILPFNPSR